MSRFYFSFFCIIFSKFILFCIFQIYVDKNSFRNHSLIYFKTKPIKLALQLSLDFFLVAIIINSLSEWLDCGIVWYVLRKQRDFLKETRSIPSFSS